MIYFELFLGGYNFFLKFWGITSVPYFVDLKILLCGIDAMRDGINPYNSICVNNIAYYNYPIIWGIFSYLPFLTVKNTIIIGIVLAIIFTLISLHFFGKLDRKKIVYYSLLLFSPATILALERGNCDLIIYILILVALINKLYKNYFFSIILLFTSFLKLFPFGAFFSVLFLKWKNYKIKYLTLITMLVMFGIYLILISNDLIMVSNKTPRPIGYHAFGLGNIPGMLMAKYGQNKLIWFFYLIFTTLIIIIIFFKTNANISQLNIYNNKFGTAFIVGSCIFLTTYLIGNNFEYRLIFLILCIPQLFIWSIDKNDPTAKAILLIILIVFWQSFFGLTLKIPFYVYFGQFLVLILFSILMTFVLNYFKIELQKLNNFIKHLKI